MQGTLGKQAHVLLVGAGGLFLCLLIVVAVAFGVVLGVAGKSVASVTTTELPTAAPTSLQP